MFPHHSGRREWCRLACYAGWSAPWRDGNGSAILSGDDPFTTAVRELSNDVVPVCGFHIVNRNAGLFGISQSPHANLSKRVRMLTEPFEEER